MNKTKLFVLGAALFLMGAFSASAQIGPQILNPVSGGSCLDGDGNWTVSCFDEGHGGSGGDQCATYAFTCANACATTEIQAFNHCATISDPVGQGNCYVYAQMDWQACQNQCDMRVASGSCY